MNRDEPKKHGPQIMKTVLLQTCQQSPLSENFHSFERIHHPLLHNSSTQQSSFTNITQGNGNTQKCKRQCIGIDPKQLNALIVTTNTDEQDQRKIDINQIKSNPTSHQLDSPPKPASEYPPHSPQSPSQSSWHYPKT